MTPFPLQPVTPRTMAGPHGPSGPPALQHVAMGSSNAAALATASTTDARAPPSRRGPATFRSVIRDVSILATRECRERPSLFVITKGNSIAQRLSVQVLDCLDLNPNSVIYLYTLAHNLPSLRLSPCLPVGDNSSW